MTQYMLELRLVVSYSRLYQQMTVCGLYLGRGHNKVDDCLCSSIWEFMHIIVVILLLIFGQKNYRK